MARPARLPDALPREQGRIEVSEAYASESMPRPAPLTAQRHTIGIRLYIHFGRRFLERGIGWHRGFLKVSTDLVNTASPRFIPLRGEILAALGAE
ncbi:hypothetical protein CF70_025240 [Cupriavidus sp. SK-3]|nr:hypothetical protein CF70_025240 [Cupriavidus sp. SK-3]